ncbi:hypothetical protein [Streptomyces litmocidini]|nr:hypothetical protein [Streptomyces litmocidini]
MTSSVPASSPEIRTEAIGAFLPEPPHHAAELELVMSVGSW